MELLSEGSLHFLALADTGFHPQLSTFLSGFVTLRFFSDHFYLD